jgi:hypothetical protein
MYVPPSLRCNGKQSITDFCDEFLHIDETPEANVPEFCIKCEKACDRCKRKSVTCVAILEKDEKTIYQSIYKNRPANTRNAIHAEVFMIYDEELRKKLDFNQTLTLYLTFQPCHFSGGHYKAKQNSCTEALLQFQDKILKPLDINLCIKFSYMYRAHWIMESDQYDEMIENAKRGLRLLKENCDVKIMTEIDFLRMKEISKSDITDNDLKNVMKYRKPLQYFLENTLEEL